MTGDLNIFTLNSQHRLEEITTVQSGYPLDNVHIDSNGDVYSAAFPHAYRLVASGKQPFDINPSAAVLRFRKVANRDAGETAESQPAYVVEKVLEDDGSVLPGTTVAVHDELLDRFFLGGVVSPFITICEPRK